jgi:3-deoxy-manno-octulosonate cytidylyltransferase (CMP-KDO synthetase)
LLDLGGKPVVQHVWERARRSKLATSVVILADTEEVAAVARGFGAEVVMTDPACPNGTYRLASALDRLPGDFFINVQGDEPFIAPELIDALAERHTTTHCALVTAVTRLTSSERLLADSVVKVVRAENGEALYFSRSPVPHLRGVPVAEWTAHRAYWGHLGIYGYDRTTLARYPSLPATELEACESLEQLRFIAHGYRFQTVETNYHPVAIDTAADLEHARSLVKG